MQHLQQFVALHGKKITYKNSKMIFKAGDKPTNIYLLKEGYVKTFYEAENGETITLSLFKPGDFFGVAELFSQKTAHDCSAIGFGEVTLYAISIEQISAQLAKDPSFWADLTQILANKIIDAHQLIMRLTNLSVPERLAAFLKQYATIDENDNLAVNIPLSHEEISYIINCSRQKVTSYLNLWRKQGFISYERGNIQIRQPDAIFH